MKKISKSVFPTIEQEMVNKNSVIREEILVLLGEISVENEFEFFKYLGSYILGKLERQEKENLPSDDTNILEVFLRSHLNPYAEEDAILNDLWEIFWWGDAKTTVAAAKFLKSEYNQFYNEDLAKTLAFDLLYGKGCYLVNA